MFESFKQDEEINSAEVESEAVNEPNLTSAEGLTLPQPVGGDLDPRGLTSAEGLTLPESVGGDLDLRGLTSAEGLTLPE